MAAPFPKPKDGEPLQRDCSGFPMFFDKTKPRVITADAWAFLEHLVAKKLKKSDRAQPLAFIEQAYDFYEAAENPQLGSKPLLYYYSFLNLAKVALILKGVSIPAAIHHGISDPRVNIRQRFHLRGQILRIKRRKNDHSELFPEFITLLGGSATNTRNIDLLVILKQIPSIHRTFTQVTSQKNNFVPIKDIELLTHSDEIWGRIVLDKNDRDVDTSLKILKNYASFKNSLTRVASQAANKIFFETQPSKIKGGDVDAAIRAVAKKIRSAQLSAILTQGGYCYYFNCINKSNYLPPLAASYAAMFYLGSITRYKPADFDEIRAGKYGWICEELLATQPTQFLYILCSELAGVDVVVPHSLVIR